MRKALIPENRFGRYFFYAVGEIVLVVIGILIALQVNNWNEERKALKEEQNILKNLHSEFIQNKKVLKEVLRLNDQCFETGKLVMSLVGREEDIILQYNLDSLLFYFLETMEFNASDNAIQDLFQSGRFKFISNDNLKNSLFDWTRTSKTIDKSYNDIYEITYKQILPYFYKNYPLKDIDKYGPLNWSSSSLLKHDKLKIFNELEFENIVDDYLFQQISYRTELKDVEVLIDAILKETNID